MKLHFELEIDAPDTRRIGEVLFTVKKQIDEGLRNGESDRDDVDFKWEIAQIWQGEFDLQAFIKNLNKQEEESR